MNQGNLPGTGGQFVSPLVPLPATTGAYPTFNHGLHTAPPLVVWVIVCRTANQGFAPGDEVPLDNLNGGSATYSNWRNGTQVGLAWISTTINVPNKVTGALTTAVNADWALKCYARL